MGLALKEQGKLPGFEAFNKANSIKPDNPDGYYNMGNAFKEQGKLEGSKGLQKALAINLIMLRHITTWAMLLKQNKRRSNKAYTKAISIKPDNSDVYYNMGNAFKEQGKLDETIEAYHKSISLKPDHHSANHMLAALTGINNETAPREYVENLFDGYSDRFEASLVEELEYTIPKLIKDIVIKLNNKKLLGSVLDLGCGSGLVGLEIKDHCSRVEGIDLSKKMLELAKQKDVYDKLRNSDIVEYLSGMPLNLTVI